MAWQLFPVERRPRFYRLCAMCGMWSWKEHLKCMNHVEKAAYVRPNSIRKQSIKREHEHGEEFCEHLNSYHSAIDKQKTRAWITYHLNIRQTECERGKINQWDKPQSGIDLQYRRSKPTKDTNQETRKSNKHNWPPCILIRPAETWRHCVDEQAAHLLPYPIVYSVMTRLELVHDVLLIYYASTN